MSTLFNNRMLLLLKGTYASDDPLSFDELNGGTGALYQDLTGDGLDPAFDLTDLPLAKDLLIHIDFGEVRISSKYRGPTGLDLLENARQSSEFWDFIGSERQVYCTIAYTIFANTCQKNLGYARIVDFFNGAGAQFPSNDPTADARGFIGSQYYHAGVYFRGMVTSFAKENGAQLINTSFDNNIVAGANIVPRNSYLPTVTEVDKETVTPLMFPVFYTVEPGHQDFTIRPGFDPYILEMRMNIKENLMVHSWTTLNGYTQTMVGFSDWRYNHTGQADMGGNLLLRARVIYPEYASRLTITGGTQTLSHYYALFRAEEENLTSQLPLASVPVRSGSSVIKYIHEGNYRLRCLSDTSPVDGFPETFVRETFFSVSNYPRQEITVDLTCP
ncbi:MAG: hypothetical protein KDK36_14470 [Leptospiraceae bacterium]|nr:hypothetical protein [Leptospiraceae bacterium]